jgi:hypothetical protein
MGSDVSIVASADLRTAWFNRVLRFLLDSPLVRLGLRLLRGFRRLGLFALAALEVIIRFAWYVGRSGTQGSGSSKSPDLRALTSRLH